MKQYLKFLMLLVLSLALIAGINSCGKESSGGIEPTPVNPTPNNGGGGGKTEPEKPDDKPTPIGDGKVKVFEQVVAVQESEITSVKSDTAAHHYTITYNNAAPEIKPGNVVVVTDNGETRIILVTSAKIDGNKVELDGPLGDLSYVFFDTDFTLTTNIAAVDNADGKTVYMPNNSVSLSKNGKEDKTEWNEFTVGNYNGKFSGEIGLSQGKLTGGIELKLTDKNAEALSYSMKTDVGLSLVVKNRYSGIITKAVKFDNDINYGQGFVMQDITFQQSAVEITECYLDGDLSITGSMDIKAKGTWTKSGKKEDDMLILEDPKPNIYTFLVGEVPIVVFTGIDWYWNWKVAGELGVDVNFTLVAANTSKYGLKMTTDNKADKTNYELICDSDFDINPKVDVNGYVDVSASIYGYPLLWFSIIHKKAVGFGMKLKPKASVEIGCGGGYGAGANLDFQNDDFSGEAHLKCGYKASANLAVAAELGFYRKKFIGGDLKFRPLPFDWNNKDGFSLKSEGGDIKILGLNYETPSALTAAKISSASKTMEYGTDFFLDKDNKKKNVIEFPVKAGEPVTISFRIFDRLYNDNKLLIDKRFSEFVPAWVFLKTRKTQDIFFFKEDKSDYVWTPQSSNDYLEAVIYDYKDKEVGYMHIGDVDFDFVGIKDVYFTSSDDRLLSTTEKCNMTLYIDGNEVGRFENVDEIKFDLSNYEGEHTFKVAAETDYNCQYKSFSAKVVLGDPLKLNCIPVREATSGDPAILTASTYKISKIILYVDGVEKTSVFSGMSLSYDVSQLTVGSHKIKIVAQSGFETTEVEFNCIVNKKPDTPATGNTTVPDVSGTDIDQKNTGAGYAPNVNGQNVNSEYNSGGTTPSVKGQNLDQYYNGGGSTPDIKGSNL